MADVRRESQIKLLQSLAALDRALVAKRFPPLSPWWNSTFSSFLASDKRQLIARVGRRGGKSSSLCRLAVAFALAYDVRSIPPGDVGVVAFVSVTKTEARSRLRTIKAILDAIKVKWKPIPDGVELEGIPIAFQGFACTIGAVSGFTSILVIADEVSKWLNEDTGTNPADEVLAAIRPTMATQRAGRIVLSSSPMGFKDAHALAFDLGDTEHQQVVKAESWVANPTLTEAWTRKDEPHEATWRREYAAIPTGGANGAFLAEDIDAAIRPLEGLTIVGKPILLLDSSAGSGDAWTWCAAAWTRPNFDPADQYLWEEVGEGYKRGLITERHGRMMRQVLDANGAPVPDPEFGDKARPVLALYRLGAIEGRFRENITAEDAVALATKEARRSGATKAVGDQYQSFFLESACKKQGVTYKQVTWSNTSKVAAITTLRRWMRARMIALEPGTEGEALRQELLGFEEKLSPSGILTFGARRGGHDDRVALLINAAMAESLFMLEGSPNGRNNRRHELHDYDDSQDE